MTMNEDIVTIHIWRTTAEQIVDAHTLTIELFEDIVNATRIALAKEAHLD